AVEGLADRLVRRSPAFSHAYILGSGSEAVEAALKLARQYWVERGEKSKHKIIALTPGYHGNTLLALSASAREHYRKYWNEWLVAVRRVAAPYAYRCGCDGDPSCGSCTGWGIEQAITEEGAETVAAVILEPVGGSSTGASVPRDEYLRQVREICDRLGVLMIADEVLCGAGRTGTWTAMEQWRVVPDIMTLGKGIGGGYAPLSAVLARRDVVDVIARGSGALLHAQTFSHHAVTCAAGVATLDYIERHALVERCRTMEVSFHEKLQALREHPAVGDVRGIGLLAGIEFVADRGSRAPLARELKFAERLTQAARDQGLIIWPNVGQADGTNGDIACLAPPYVIEQNEIDEIVRRLLAALQAVAPT
ncbi:MAG: aminotransferase class III-fold pyridoxal phosphate-dependent enzyme, partial [Gemmatimonadaceae bacterium]